MATSSIKKNFIVYGDEQAEAFVNAMEKSANYTAPEIEVEVKKINDLNELRALMAKRKKMNA